MTVASTPFLGRMMAPSSFPARTTSGESPCLPDRPCPDRSLRICIWGAAASSSTSESPHPLELVDTIATGHRANIFSARFLPNTSTPTIVSCAGDKDIRIFEVDRLSRADVGRGIGLRDELWGVDGPGCGFFYGLPSGR